jgi:S-adenosylmethionine decarboxylase
MKTKRPYLEHFIIEVFDIKFNIKKVEDIQDRLDKFISECKLSVVKEDAHNFSPFGFTKIYVLSESHIAFHSWPENNYLNIDLLSCKNLVDSDEILKIAKNIFDSENVLIKKVGYK